MASVKKDPTRNKTPWVVRWRDEEGNLRKRGFARKADADRFRAEVEHSLNTGTYVDPKGGRRLFREYAEEVRQAQLHRDNTVARWISNLNVHAYPAFGHRPIAAIRHTEMQAWITGLGAKLAPGSARTVAAPVLAVFGAAVRDRIIGRNPCDDLTFPEVVPEEVIPLTVDQVEVLCEKIAPRYRVLVVVGSGLGHRQGEAFGLEVEDIDFLRRKRVRVERQIQPIKGGGVAVVPPKNKASFRHTPSADVILAELSAHLAAFPPIEVEVLDRTGKQPTMRKARFVFATPAGEPLNRNSFNDEVWAPARVAAAEVFRKRAADERDPDRAAELLQQADQLAECGFHDLRHFFASALIRRGLSVKAVAAALGHASPAVTLRIYTHLWPDDEDRTREAIEAVFRPATVGTSWAHEGKKHRDAV